MTVTASYGVIVLGTVLWDAGAILQKQAIEKLGSARLRVIGLVGSARWMLGLAANAVGWGLFVLGLNSVPVSVARTVTGGSYVILALFSTVFLRTPLKLAEWMALLCVTGGIVILGMQGQAGGAAADTLLPSVIRLALGLGMIVVVSCGTFLFARRSGSVFAFAAISGLLSGAGDLMVKLITILAREEARPLTAMGMGRLGLSGVGMVLFYVTGIYMLSRAYQVGTVVAGMVISDFFARVAAIFLGVICLSETLIAAGTAGPLYAVGFLMVLGGSLLLGRFSSRPVKSASS